jgi:hypothetical protein
MDHPSTRPATWWVMLSSTFRDLEKHRDVVLGAMPSYGMLPAAMEFDAALPAEDLISASLKKVEQSDAYVGIIGYRYGQMPVCTKRNPQKFSLTELEFRHAVELKKPICMFLMSEKHPVPAGDIQKESGTKTKLKAFRKLASKDRIYAEFDSVDDLRAKAGLSLHKLQHLLEGENAGTAPQPQAQPDPINKAPEFYAVTDYIPGHAFVGRTRDLLLLDDWAKAGEPVLLFEAIGGMGKSMLTWHWVRTLAPKVRADWAGRFWYSFYERGADMSDFCAYALAYTTGRPLKEFRGRTTAALTSELIATLHAKSWLFVLDGLERVLVAYNRYDAAQAADEDVAQDPDRAGRHPEACIRPADEELLRLLAGVQPSKVLITSRLMPRALLNRSDQPLPGVRRIGLQGLDPADAERLMRDAGVRGDSVMMQQYVQRHFAGHPLVVGVVAGLVTRYRSAPGDFERWSEDSSGGADPDLASMDLVQRRNHILKAALDDLTPEERVLMVRLGLVSDSVDLATIEALNPHRTEPPRKVEDPEPLEGRVNWQLRRLERQLQTAERDGRISIQQKIDRIRGEDKAKYEREKGAYDEYLRLHENWQKSPERKAEGDRLQQTLDDLEQRGLLNWDRSRNQYDLHPVVRNYSIHCLPVAEREHIGRRVVDHFTSRVDPPYEGAETMADIRNGLQVVRSLVQIGDLEPAYKSLQAIYEALWFNLERYSDYLSLLRPSFPNGWTKPPRGPESEHGFVAAACAAVALNEVGRTVEALAASMWAIADAVRVKDQWNLGFILRNHCRFQMEENSLEAAERVLLLEEELAALDVNEDHRAMIISLRLDYSLKIGRVDDAEAALGNFNAASRPKYRSSYRRGDAEAWLVELRLRQDRLDEEMQSAAMRAARESKNRGAVRSLHAFRGEWLFSLGQFAESEAAFEEAIAMARESGLPTPEAEAWQAVAQVKQGKIEQARGTSDRLALLDDPPQISLAELFLALGDRAPALDYAKRGYKCAWADGMPYVKWWDLQRSRAVLQALGEPEPRLPPFDPNKVTPLPFEADVRAFIEELKAKKKEDASGPPEESEPTA